LTDPDLSLSFEVSGDDEGDGVCRVNESARSATDGDLEELRVLAFRTEKKAVEAPEFGAIVPTGVAFGAELESFSRALILCDIPDPRLTFLGTGLGACWLMRFRKAAPALTDPVGPG
jgi:hypothetical protein